MIKFFLKLILDILNILFLSLPKLVSKMRKKSVQTQIDKFIIWIINLFTFGIPLLISFLNEKIKKL